MKGWRAKKNGTDEHEMDVDSYQRARAATSQRRTETEKPFKLIGKGATAVSWRLPQMRRWALGGVLFRRGWRGLTGQPRMFVGLR